MLSEVTAAIITLFFGGFAFETPMSFFSLLFLFLFLLLIFFVAVTCIDVVFYFAQMLVIF